MSSDTPAYYPKGWDRERQLNVGVTNELDGLTEDQWATFRDFHLIHVFHGHKRAVFESPSIGLVRLREQRVGSTAQWNPWGFVVFKSPEIHDQAWWQACRERFD
ncbi:hypothetical protein F4801DRAFT_579827 [Xylaria longipes]|nr:hypothetical protein F4801DRAFT_579827 [Xylaria longipes]RYC58338.1 hypothetical protein CHU98_g7887 [Xylaria longipes]